MNKGLTGKERKEMKEKIKSIKVKPDSKPKDKKKKGSATSRTIDVLGLSARAYKFLKKKDIQTIDELSEKTVKQLLKYKYLDEKTDKVKSTTKGDIDEYREKLGSFNLSLANDYVVKGVIEDLIKKLNRSDVIIGNLRKKINNISSKLNLHINKKTAQIRVLEKNGKWSGYTGVFYINAKDHQKKIVNKALNHYEEYFKDDDFYKNRTLGLFTTNAKGQKLVKVLQDNENKLEKNGKK